MADTQLKTYTRSPQPQIPGAERKWLDEELKKLEDVLRAIHAAIEELRTKVGS